MKKIKSHKLMLRYMNTNARGVLISLLVSVFLIIGIIFLPALAPAASQDIGGVLKTYIKDNYPWDEVEIKDVTMSYDITDRLPERIFIEKGLPGRTVFSLEFKNGQKVTATAFVKAFDRVIMSRRAFTKGGYLRKDDLYTKMMDVTQIPKDVVKNIEQAADKQLTRSIAANVPVLSNMISETQYVKKGRRVVLLVESAGFSMTAIGEIKENAFVGNYAKAVNLASKKTVTGMLVNENTIKVEF